MKVKIVNSEWAVERVQAHDPALYVDGTVRCGACWPAKKRIVISDELIPDSEKEVIRHELCHAVFSETQITRSEQFSEEEVCDMVGKWGGFIEELQARIFETFLINNGGDKQ